MRTKLRAAAVLAVASCAIWALDIATGKDVTVRPLLCVIVILTGFLEDRFIGFLFSAFSATLFAVSFAVSQKYFATLSLCVNFLGAFLAYVLLAESALLAVRTISKLSKMVLDAHEEITRLTEAKERGEG
ncbi:hypothetical protein WOC76_15920 [Methylocystis sp. IM3]|uniref:hypothetical protein n=1 Tax=unclassified Methylocystis TaxID=2625913 RepID=UPI0030FC82C0